MVAAKASAPRHLPVDFDELSAARMHAGAGSARSQRMARRSCAACQSMSLARQIIVEVASTASALSPS